MRWVTARRTRRSPRAYRAADYRVSAFFSLYGLLRKGWCSEDEAEAPIVQGISNPADHPSLAVRTSSAEERKRPA